MDLKRTHLYQESLNKGAKMVPFAGWEMALQYSGVFKEHAAVREEVGLFDISHMGIVQLTGTNPKDKLQKLVPSDLNRIGAGEACYTVLLNENGGIIDDLIIYDQSRVNSQKEDILIILNAARKEIDIAWLRKHLTSKNIEISDLTSDSILFALQGPESTTIMQDMCEHSLEDIPRFGHKILNLNYAEDNNKEKIFIARTGYTGEDGFELILPPKIGISLWKKLLDKGVTPCGLGARDTLRLEAAMHLYGHEMNETTTPFEAGLGWLVHLEMHSDFIGRNALEKQAHQGIKQSLVGIELSERAIARQGYPILYQNKKIGKITSGTWSPTLSKAIAMAYVPVEFKNPGTCLEIEIRNNKYIGTVVKRPFYRKA